MEFKEIVKKCMGEINNFRYGHGRYFIYIDNEEGKDNFSIEIRIADNKIKEVWASRRLPDETNYSFVVTPTRYKTLDEQIEKAEEFYNENLPLNESIMVFCKPADMDYIYVENLIR